MGAKNTRLNNMRAARFRLNIYLKSKGIKTNGRKLMSLISQFAELRDVTITKNARQWLLDAYLDGSLNDCMPFDGFYNTMNWKRLRQEIIDKYGAVCMKCGSTEKIHVDHIKPRSKYPHLELVKSNLQILCFECNIRKGNRNEIDYRNLTVEHTGPSPWNLLTFDPLLR